MRVFITWKGTLLLSVLAGVVTWTGPVVAPTGTVVWISELDTTQTRQYGLVAEEVAQVAPQLVVFDKDGAPQTVRYHFVNAMLLNEVQKQRQLIEEQRRENAQQRTTISAQESRLHDLEARLAKLEAAITGR